MFSIEDVTQFVYNIVENSVDADLDLGYEDVCDMMQLDAATKKKVLTAIDNDLAIV